MSTTRQRATRAKAVAAAEQSGATTTRSDAPSSPSSVMSRVDKTGLYDLQQVKRVLDDQVVDYLEQQGYTEATLASNVKILCGTIAVAAAFYSHFNGQEFPDNRNLIMLCVAVYGVCMALISAVSYLYEGDSFYSAHLSDVAELMAGQALAPCVWVHSALGEQGSSTYTLTLRRGVRKSPVLSAVLAKPYEQFYCEDGQLAVAELQSDLSRLLIKLGKLGPTEKSK